MAAMIDPDGGHDGIPGLVSWSWKLLTVVDGQFMPNRPSLEITARLIMEDGQVIERVATYGSVAYASFINEPPWFPCDRKAVALWAVQELFRDDLPDRVKKIMPGSTSDDGTRAKDGVGVQGGGA